MNIEEESRAIADGLQNYIAGPRREELARDIAATLQRARNGGLEEAETAVNRLNDESRRNLSRDEVYTIARALDAIRTLKE